MKGVSQAGRRAVRRRVRRQKGGGALRALAGCLIATLLVLAAVRFGHCGFDDSCGSHLSSDFSGLVRSLAGGRRPPPVAPSYAAASGSAMTVPLHQGGSAALPAGRLARRHWLPAELPARSHRGNHPRQRVFGPPGSPILFKKRLITRTSVSKLNYKERPQ